MRNNHPTTTRPSTMQNTIDTLNALYHNHVEPILSAHGGKVLTFIGLVSIVAIFVGPLARLAGVAQ